jgi:hypothetical protein
VAVVGSWFAAVAVATVEAMAVVAAAAAYSAPFMVGSSATKS